MKRRSVMPKTIDTVSYENGTMAIKTSSGRIYEYGQVPEVIYRQFQAYQFAGRWYDRHIKNKYPLRAIRSIPL